VVTGPIIILIGLNLAPSAVSNASTCWPLALLSIAVIVVANIWGKGMIKIIPILLGVVVPYLVALACTFAGIKLIDFSGLSVQGLFGGLTPILGFQPFVTDFSGSICKFDISAILVMAPIAVATMMEHIGDMSAISATVGENFIENPGLHRTLIGDGVATALSAIFGGPANTTYGENTGVLVLSKVYDPKVVRLAALYAIILSFSPAFAYIINTIPAAIIGGVSFILYGMISAIGVRNVVENQVDFTNSRNLIIAAVILVCGLGFTGGLTFQLGNASITLTSLAIAAVAGIILNAILPGNDFHFGKAADDAAGSLGKY
jgi:uracil permease